MPFVRYSLLCLLACFFVAPAFAQDGQQQEIEERLDEVQKMIEEERSTISTLESQLKNALDKNDADQVERLRDEIDAAYDSLDQLEELNKQLKDLLEASQEEKPQPRLRRGKRRVPNPSIGGLESGDLNEERIRREQRERDRERNRRANPANPGLGIGAGNNSRNESNRLRHLRDALDALIDAGEDRLADNVQDLIEMEERKMDRDRDREARDRDRERERSDDRGNRGGANRGGGFMVDGPSDRRGNSRPQNNPPTERNRSRSSRDDEMEDLQDEIDRLNDKLKELRERGDGR